MSAELTKEQLDQLNHAFSQWYALGWNVGQDTLSVKDAVRILKMFAVAAHTAWVHDVKQGNVPDEDISPGEGILRIAHLLEHAAQHGHVVSIGADNAVYDPGKDEDLKEIESSVHKGIDEIAPGYFGGGDGDAH